MNKKIVALILSLVSFSYLNGFDLIGRSFISPRSQSVNAARDLVGWHNEINKYDEKGFYWASTIIPEYTQSLRSKRIAQQLFGDDRLVISGSQVVNRGDDDILADYFGLSPLFQSNLHLEPRIKTGIISLDVYLGYKNIYLRINAPIVMTRWDLNLEEEVFNNGVGTQFPARYMSLSALNAPATSFKAAIKGGQIYGDIIEGIQSGKIDGGKHKSGLSDLQIIRGWNFINRPNVHVGFNIRTAAPTGSRSKSEFLFEPVVGNGKHWELGIGLTGRILIWELNSGEREISFFADTNFTHLFKSRQTRSFDFKPRVCPQEKNFGSRYILLKTFDTNGNYIAESVPAINKTTLKSDISVDIQADLVFMFGYTHAGMVVDLGYNGWIRSKEKISLCEKFPDKTYGLKGIQNVRTLANLNSVATESTATLHGEELSNQAALTDPNSPVLLTQADLDLSSASTPLAITHKFFANINHTWHVHDEQRSKPFIGIGGQIEFEGINTRLTEREDKNAITQWGVWIKGGVAY